VPDLRNSDRQRIAHRDLRVFAILEQAPAVAEEPVTVDVKEFGERVGDLERGTVASWGYSWRKS
jgi:hypothetical protein